MHSFMCVPWLSVLQDTLDNVESFGMDEADAALEWMSDDDSGSDLASHRQRYYDRTEGNAEAWEDREPEDSDRDLEDVRY